MPQGLRPGRALLVAVALLSLLATPAHATVELKDKTVEAFNHYVHLTEARMAEEVKGGTNSFLWLDPLPENRRHAVREQLRQGRVIIEHLETKEGGKRIKVPDGLIHHWMAMSFLRGVTLKQTLALMQDYDNHADVYKSDVQRSKLLSANGNHFKVFLRLHRKAIVTAVFNAEFDITYFFPHPTMAYSRSYSTRIAEVENPGQPDEREKPVGQDSGYLWRLHSYWRFEEKDGGVYAQVESIALSRPIPFLFSWLVNPLLKSIPREYLTRVMDSLRDAVVHRSRAGAAIGATLPFARMRNPRMAGLARLPYAARTFSPGG